MHFMTIYTLLHASHNKQGAPIDHAYDAISQYAH